MHGFIEINPKSTGDGERLWADIHNLYAVHVIFLLRPLISILIYLDMISLNTLTDQTLATRETIVKLLKTIPVEQADTIPPTWKNNARWHAGHLIITPCLLTYGLLKEPLTVPEEYRTWFAKGTDPTQWPDSSAVPTLSDLADDIMPVSGRIFDAMKDRADEPLIEPYKTSVGIVLKNTGEALSMSLMHDGIHLGMLLALKRALQVAH